MVVPLVIAGALAGCKAPDPAPVMVERITQSSVDKIDLVLAVDNSAGMADKQAILARSIPRLVRGLVLPRCLDDNTHRPIADAAQPQDPTQPCPAGSTHEFPPVLDIHIGLLSSSLGSFGANACDQPPPACAGGSSNPNNDQGHLVTRADPCGRMPPVQTYKSLGFLAWDPAKKLSPPGISTVSDLESAVAALVVGNGELGCGVEAQNESWYRFLVDPTPYASIFQENGQAQRTGIDEQLLDQRKAFLRPDSLLAIVVVSDESDTSLKQFGPYPLFAAPKIHLPHAASACGTSPKDPCCHSCGVRAPPGCPQSPDDPACATPLYSDVDEDPSLRAFGLIGHKSLYGIEFFYQPSRYIAALTSATVPDVKGNQVPNPIYSNLDPAHFKRPVRDPGRVFYATITGVPWQLLARQMNGVPDLIGGVSAVDATVVGGFRSAQELTLNDSQGNVLWDDVAGDPENYVAAKSPFMVESTTPRPAATDPITNVSIAPANTPNGAGSEAGGSLLNDHERTIKSPPNDIEYACVFDILSPKDCWDPAGYCECPRDSGGNNPLCAPDPNRDDTPTLQVKAKAYPGIKHLAIARGMGGQGIAASICSRQVADPTAADYGYHPAMDAIVDRLKVGLHTQCFPRALKPDGNRQVSCLVLEATHTGGACNCDPAQARAPISDGSNGTADHRPAVTAAQQDPQNATAKWDCFCEIAQLSSGALDDCQTNPDSTANGWCYVDAVMGPEEAAIVANCPSTERHNLRFVGLAAPKPGATQFITCAEQ